MHGSIDLVYRDEAGWHVIDFKTDRLDGTSAAAVARGYHVQIGLYQQALAAAIGGSPTAGLLFLRTGEVVEPSAADLGRALGEARALVDAGARLEPAASEHQEGDWEGLGYALPSRATGAGGRCTGLPTPVALALARRQPLRERRRIRLEVSQRPPSSAWISR